VTAFGWISLLTDYGLDDGFVAACHGVIASVAPNLRVIDITHLVPPGDIARGAAVLAQTVPSLPPAGHVAVVDPGVGTSRRAVAVVAGGSVLVGPDNGLLVPAAAALGGIDAAYELGEDRWWRHPVSATFHGRDIFCPVAAHVANGTDPAALGPAIEPAGLHRLAQPAARVEDLVLTAQVVTVDRFGNVQLAATALPAWAVGQRLAVVAGGQRRTATFATTFAEVGEGELVALQDSAGRLALAVNRGHAAARLQLAPGDTVTVGPAD
jgi:S-adenosylmethionine hydrolase